MIVISYLNFAIGKMIAWRVRQRDKDYGKDNGHTYTDVWNGIVFNHSTSKNITN